jgi:hypothetical protein
MEPQAMSLTDRGCSEPRSHVGSAAGRARGGHERRIDIVPRCSITEAEAAASLGMSIDTFRRHVRPHVPCMVIGKGERLMRYYRLEDLRRFVEQRCSIGA